MIVEDGIISTHNPLVAWLLLEICVGGANVSFEKYGWSLLSSLVSR